MLLRKVLMAVVVSLILFAAPLAALAQDAQTLMQQADSVWVKRSASL